MAEAVKNIPEFAVMGQQEGLPELKVEEVKEKLMRFHNIFLRTRECSVARGRAKISSAEARTSLIAAEK